MDVQRDRLDVRAVGAALDGGDLDGVGVDEADRGRLRGALQPLVDEGLLDYLTWSLTTPYPGSELYEIAARHNLISEEYRGQWDKIEPIWNFTMQLSGVSDEDWRTIKSRGARLQARCVLRGGRLNISTAKLIMQRGMSMIALDTERFKKNLIKGRRK